ncbi:MAG: FkbM family methyltransferase [Bacteroidota bacterium]
MRKIYKKCNAKKFRPQHVAEIGVYKPEESNILDFINDGIRTTLVEAHPTYVALGQKFFQDNDNITIHPVAVYDQEGEIDLLHQTASTFLEVVNQSPTIVNDYYRPSDNDRFTVKCTRFSNIDDGTIDLLSIDIEGAEWYAIKHLVSSPAIISVETHGKRYTNPFITEIKEWMKNKGYVAWYKDNSDTVYVQPEHIRVTLLNRIALVGQNARLQVRKIRSHISEFVKSFFRIRTRKITR